MLNEEHKVLLEGITQKDLIKVHKNLKLLKNPKTDGRKCRISKKEMQRYINSIKYAIRVYKMEIKHTQLMNDINRKLVFNQYVSLNRKNRIKLLRNTDNALILLFANEFGKYPKGDKLIDINKIHGAHYTNIVNKLKKEKYTLPLAFMAPNIEFEDL